MHACMHTYIHTCMHTYIHTYMHPCIHTYIQTYVCMYMFLYVRTYECVYACMCTHICVGMSYLTEVLQKMKPNHGELWCLFCLLLNDTIFVADGSSQLDVYKEKPSPIPTLSLQDEEVTLQNHRKYSALTWTLPSIGEHVKLVSNCKATEKCLNPPYYELGD